MFWEALVLQVHFVKSLTMETILLVCFSTAVIMIRQSFIRLCCVSIEFIVLNNGPVLNAEWYNDFLHVLNMLKWSQTIVVCGGLVNTFLNCIQLVLSSFVCIEERLVFMTFCDQCCQTARELLFILRHDSVMNFKLFSIYELWIYFGLDRYQSLSILVNITRIYVNIR